MNNSSLHLELVKLYLLYFESGNSFEDTKTRRSYARTVRYLKQIEKLARQRRMEVKETYKNTEEYKKLRDTYLLKKIEILKAKTDEKNKGNN